MDSAHEVATPEPTAGVDSAGETGLSHAIRSTGASGPLAGTRGLIVRAGLAAGVGLAAGLGGLATAAVLDGPIGLGAATAGLIGMGAAFAVAWRWVRGAARPVLGVVDALELYDGGEAGDDALRLVDAGPLSTGWNRLVSRRADAVEAAHLSELDERSGSGRAAGSTGLAHAVDALWQGLVLIDADLRVLHANGAAAVLLGVSKESMEGVTFTGLDLPGDVAQAVRDVVEGKRGRNAVEMTRGDGPTRSVVKVSTRRVRRDDRGEALVVLEDVTQQRVAEESRHAMLAQTVHELRSPLTTIRLHVEEAIDAQDGDTETWAMAIDVINKEARRLERVVSEMLSVSEMESGAFEVHADDIRLQHVFDELRSDYAAQAASKSIELAFELPPKWPVARADREKLTVALHNLVGNAVKYTPSEGRVTVRVEADDRELSVEVEDTGIGIRSEDQERVFERFFRSEDGRATGVAGSGLGLATAREIARKHGGDITLRSAPGEGSAFTLKIPTTPGAPSTGNAGATDTGEAPRAQAA